MVELTSRFEDALLYAVRLHAGQARKASETPYVAHLLGVTALVLEAGGDEDQAIAALLHDAVEDQGGLETLEDIRRRYGERVAHIVDGCTDSYTTPKVPWRKRKEDYLQRLPGEPPEVRLVSLADKLHNARTILADLQREGEKTWDKFNGGKEGTLWYYRSLLAIFSELDRNPWVTEFGRVVNEMEQLAKRR